MPNIFKLISNLLISLYAVFPENLPAWALLILRVGLGVLFVLHGYPKLNHLKIWSNALKMPIYLCFLSAVSMFLGGFCLIAGFLTPFTCLALLCSMVFALILEVSQGLPLVAIDPYLIPEGQYDGSDGKGEPPSQEKAFVFILMLIVLFVFGAGDFSIDAWLLSLN